MNDWNHKMMQRCLQLARNGLGTTYPNPLVGCVIENNGKIIAEGWHHKTGSPHAEAHAINQIHDKKILKDATLYVSLEPCAHYGKTPPCADLIIRHQIKKVVVGTEDPFLKVNGRGIQKMKEAGIEVITGVLDKDCREINKRFFTFHQKKRPYIILKWAETADGFMATINNKQKWISNIYSKQLVHKWRTEEQAVLVGTTTAEIDNPQLNARFWSSNQPVRLVLDKDLKLNPDLHLWDQSQRTVVFTQMEKENEPNREFVSINFDENLPESILAKLYEFQIQSVVIEGGLMTLKTFIEKGLWDEARVFTAPQKWGEGVFAPNIQGELIESKQISTDQLSIYKR